MQINLSPFASQRPEILFWCAKQTTHYHRRQQAGKTIGSGRMEKGVDQVVGMRQKDRGMSWSKRGSYALAMLTAYAANGHGDHLWNPAQVQA